MIIPDLKREKRDNLVVPFFFIKNLKREKRDNLVVPFFFIKISEKMQLFAGTVLAKSLSAAV